MPSDNYLTLTLQTVKPSRCGSSLFSYINKIETEPIGKLNSKPFSNHWICSPKLTVEIAWGDITDRSSSAFKDDSSADEIKFSSKCIVEESPFLKDSQSHKISELETKDSRGQLGSSISPRVNQMCETVNRQFFSHHYEGNYTIIDWYLYLHLILA